MTALSRLRTLWDPTADLVEAASINPALSEHSTALLRRLQFRLRQSLGSPYPGNTKGVFQGHGMELKGLREYQPGDDVRKIDWNVLARTGVPHVKEHFDEKQIPVWFVVDATLPMGFGQTQAKIGYAREVVAVLGLMALQTGQRVGLILWQGEAGVTVIPPRSMESHLTWILETIPRTVPTHARYAPSRVPDLQALLTNRCLVFLVSDLAFLEHPEASQNTWIRWSRKHQIHTLMVLDPVEMALKPSVGWLPLLDPLRGETAWVDMTDAAQRAQYQTTMAAKVEARIAQATYWGDCTRLMTDQPPLAQLMPLVRVA
jgi:uncharacterized protein (DUF58 family)